MQVNERGLPFRVTLSVGGAIISGVLTSEREYFEGLAQALKIVIGRSRLCEQYERGVRERSEEGGVSQEEIPTAEEFAARTTEAIFERVVGGYARSAGATPRYVHLRGVTIMTPGLENAEHGGLWGGGVWKRWAVSCSELRAPGERAVVAPPGKGGYEKG